MASRTAASCASCLAFRASVILTVPVPRRRDRGADLPHDRDRRADRGKAHTEGVTVATTLPALPLLAASRLSATSRSDSAVPIGVASMADFNPPSRPDGKLLGFVISVPKSVARSKQEPRAGVRIAGLVRRGGIDAVEALTRAHGWVQPGVLELLVRGRSDLRVSYSLSAAPRRPRTRRYLAAGPPRRTYFVARPDTRCSRCPCSRSGRLFARYKGGRRVPRCTCR